MKRIIFGLLLLFFLIPTSVYSAVGVGVGTGKITVDQKLKPGQIYSLPPITVLNTGDEPSNYELAMTYNEKQPQHKPPESWFIFSPRKFRLEPGKVQKVDIKLDLPLAGVAPGDYYGYLEAHPVRGEKAGVTRVNIAAAAKLYFTVVPANIFQAVYYKIVSFMQVYYPWPQRVAFVIGLVAVAIIFKRFFHIQINVKGNKSGRDHSEDVEKTAKDNHE